MDPKKGLPVIRSPDPSELPLPGPFTSETWSYPPTPFHQPIPTPLLLTPTYLLSIANPAEIGAMSSRAEATEPSISLAGAKSARSSHT